MEDLGQPESTPSHQTYVPARRQGEGVLCRSRFAGRLRYLYALHHLDFLVIYRDNGLARTDRRGDE